MADDTDLDKLTAETNAMVAEMDKPSPVQEPNRELSDDVIRAVAESAKRLNDSTVQVLKKITAAQEKLEAAPEQLRQGVKQGVADALNRLDAREAELVRRSAAIDKRGEYWLYITLASGLLIGGALVAASLLWFGPEITKYTEYRNSHKVIEEGSLFGAHLRKSEEGNSFIVFDEGVTIGPCSLPNCVGITD